MPPIVPSDAMHRARVVTMRERRETIIPFPRIELQPQVPRKHSTIAMTEVPDGNIKVLLLRFLVDPAIERQLLVKAAIEGKARTSREFISAALLRQLELCELIDPREPIETEFLALEPLVLDCGFVCKMNYEVR